MATLTAPATAYEQHRDYVLAVLARRCGWLDTSDREALLHDAYAVFLEKQRDGKLDVGGMRAPQVRAYLTQTALNKAMDEGKRAGRRSLSLDDEDLGLDPADPDGEIDERIAARFDDARVREIVAELPERQQIVIRLRFFFNHTPHEIQRYLGVTERVYRRELERATRHISERFALVREGSFCESRSSLIRGYVAGVAGPRRMAEARRHIETCPACAHLVAELRVATRRSAAVVPPPILALTAGHGLLATWLGSVRAVRHRTAELAASARGHATRGGSMADTSKLAALTGSRPGAAVMLVTGCLAGGSTTTYCIVHGIPDPLQALVGSSTGHHHRPRRVSAVVPAAHSLEAHRSRLTSAPPIHLVAETSASAQLSRVSSTPRRDSAPARRRARSSGTGRATAARARARQIHRATAAEFGAGGGSPVPVTTSGGGESGRGSSPAGGTSSGTVTPAPTAAPPRPTTHLPEFDP